jgi:GNAT superfamily N-acetyltransferase
MAVVEDGKVSPTPILNEMGHFETGSGVAEMNYDFTYRALSETLYDALIDDAFYVAMENSVAGGPDQRREAMLRYYDFSMREARKYGRLVVPDGNAFGAAIWSGPLNGDRSAQMAAEKKAFLREQMGAASLDTYARITAFMARQTGTAIPPGSWYLSIVGIAPASQGQGLGGTLLQPTLNRTDGLGIHTYLETFTPRNMPFYERLGFKTAGGFDEPETRTRYWVMVREPSDTGGAVR